ncbi:hypothetical protein BJ508DRAFT_48590 [Ascobolus immersus RN42]|uniref:Uncharacterized protein n=1 Tax=Ascobolus immersus RN42 TaxID=1160509 RepID=A0A3N4HHZ3_ASCIM|nr:hypothetical protein BJ508DRAFT_48590 [Ascobolus immersus RN42]
MDFGRVNGMPRPAWSRATLPGRALTLPLVAGGASGSWPVGRPSRWDVRDDRLAVCVRGQVHKTVVPHVQVQVQVQSPSCLKSKSKSKVRRASSPSPNPKSVQSSMRNPSQRSIRSPGSIQGRACAIQVRDPLFCAHSPADRRPACAGFSYLTQGPFGAGHGKNYSFSYGKRDEGKPMPPQEIPS